MNPETDKTVFLPGPTTSGHHQIEMVCSACHVEDFADKDAVQTACVSCHADALKAAKDDHPKSKFTDPRNADRLEVLDARYCVTCHVEHRPEITSKMGFTQPLDACVLCHEDVADDRPSHAEMEFNTCTNAGCHNFHDNRALYEDFLVKHMNDDDITYGNKRLLSNLTEVFEQLPEYPLEEFPNQPLALNEKLVPVNISYNPHIDQDWLASSHAKAGVNCTGCHSAQSSIWVDKPNHTVCKTCHEQEVSGFLKGKHGMRLDSEKLGQMLSPMTPSMARLPMHQAANDTELNCTSCHKAHLFDAKTAQVEGCLGCHADEHSTAFEQSAHARLWLKEQAGESAAGTGVSCATCHMPRVEQDYFWGTFTHNLSQHNQSETLRPNEKMLRPVCLQCHGLSFATDALADRELIRRNFTGPPSVHVESIDLAKKRLQ